MGVISEAGYGVAILVTTVAFFWRVTFLHERTFLSWYDNVVQYYAWMHHVVEGWKQFTPPLWAFATNSGISFIGELNTGVFYPLNIAFAWIVGTPSAFTLDWFIALHFAIGWYGMSLFLRGAGLSRIAAFSGGAVFMLTGSVFERAREQVNVFAGGVYIPWALACFAVACRPSSFAVHPASIAAGIALGLTLLAGYPQPFVHAVTAILAYTMWDVLRSPSAVRTSQARRSALVLTVAAVVASCTSAIQLIASYEYFGQASRWVGLDQPIQALSPAPAAARALYQLEWRHFSSFTDPHLLTPDGGTLYVTSAALAMAGFGVFPRNTLRWLGLGFVVGGVLLALGTNTPFGWLNEYLPGLRMLREPSRILCLYQFGIALLAALGFDWLLQHHRRLIAGIVIGSLSTLFVVQASRVTDRLQPARGAQYSPDPYYGQPVMAALQERVSADRHLYRVLVRPTDLLPPNQGHVNGVPTILGHRSSMQMAYFEYLSQDWTPGSRFSDRLGAKYVVAESQLPGYTGAAVFDGKFLHVRDSALPVFHFESTTGERRPMIIEHVDWHINSVSLRYAASEKGRVIFAQLAYPGWMASADDRTVSLENTDDGFMAVRTDAGSHAITFRYSPWWLPLGLTLWTVPVVAVAGIFLARRVRANRP